MVTQEKMREFDEEREIGEAIECLKSAYSEPDYEPENPNHAEELTDEAFAKSADALITPFAMAFKRCCING